MEKEIHELLQPRDQPLDIPTIDPGRHPQWTEFFIHNDRLCFLGLDLAKSPEAHATDWIEMQLERYEQQGLGPSGSRIESD